MAGRTATALGLELPVVRCEVNEGDCVLMDSRLFHCGGGNSSNVRRRLLYFSLHVPGNLPPGSTYSMLPRYTGKLRLHNYENWEEVSPF
eukprot:SAG31_NODE_7122_length_1783_cov_1.274941_1_plen_89_part_00